MVNSNIENFLLVAIFLFIFFQIINANNKQGEQFCGNCGKRRRYNGHHGNYNFYDYYYPTFGYAYQPLPCIKTLFGELKCFNWLI